MRHLRQPTAAMVDDDDLYERADVELQKWLDDIKAGYHEAIESVQQLAYESGAECYADLENAMRSECTSDALLEILNEMHAAFDAHVDFLIDARRAA